MYYIPFLQTLLSNIGKRPGRHYELNIFAFLRHYVVTRRRTKQIVRVLRAIIEVRVSAPFDSSTYNQVIAKIKRNLTVSLDADICVFPFYVSQVI